MGKLNERPFLEIEYKRLQVIKVSIQLAIAENMNHEDDPNVTARLKKAED